MKIWGISNIIKFLEKRAVFSWLLTIIYASVIFYFSSQSKPLPAMIFPSVPSVLMHVIEYVGLGVLLFISFSSLSNTRKNALLLAVIIAVLYGASDEIHQYFVPGRVCDVFDLVADSIGGFIGAFFTKKIK